MFKKCPKKLADIVINDDMAYLAPARQPPEVNEVDKLHSNLWGKEGPSDPPIPPNSASGGLLHEYFPPVIAEEILERIKKIRNRTAAGPDGIEKKHLAIPGLDTVLELLFNILFYIYHYPESWRKNRTVLIPKPNKDPNKAENWRPITIGPILARTFSSSLDRRIRRDTVQNLRQKSFTSENGCKINVELFNAALGNCKRNNGGSISIIDIAKAFDTVPHSTIKSYLARKGIAMPVISLIQKMYQGIHTSIKCKEGKMIDLKILRGVK